MQVLTLLAAVVVALCFPGAAGAVELVNPDGSVAQPYQAWADAAKVPIGVEKAMIIEDARFQAPINVYVSASNARFYVNPSKCLSDYAACHERFLWHGGLLTVLLWPDWKVAVYRRITNDTRDWQQSAVSPEGYALGSPLHRAVEMYVACANPDTIVGRTRGHRLHMPFYRVSIGLSRYHRVCRLIRQPN